MEREGARVKSILLGYDSAAIATAEPVYGGVVSTHVSI